MDDDAHGFVGEQTDCGKCAEQDRQGADCPTGKEAGDDMYSLVHATMLPGWQAIAITGQGEDCNGALVLTHRWDGVARQAARDGSIQAEQRLCLDRKRADRTVTIPSKV